MSFLAQPPNTNGWMAKPFLPQNQQTNGVLFRGRKYQALIDVVRPINLAGVLNLTALHNCLLSASQSQRVRVGYICQTEDLCLY